MPTGGGRGGGSAEMGRGSQRKPHKFPLVENPSLLGPEQRVNEREAQGANK